MLAHFALSLALGLLPHAGAAEMDPQLFGYTRTTEANCSTVDFRQNFPLAPRNQKGISWCFAHSTADALQYMEQTPVQISAADIAISYGTHSSWSKFLHFFKRVVNADDARDRPTETGLAKYAAQLIIPQGYCPEAALPSEDWTKISSDGSKSTDEVVNAALNMFDLQKDVQSGKYKSASELPYYYSFKHVDAGTFYKLLKTTKKKTLLEGLRNAACSGERIPFSRVPDIYMNLRQSRTFLNINASLNEGMPMTIDFFAGILLNIDSPLDITRHFHTILLYGRKWDAENKTCRYMLKDSYGTDCTKYDPRLGCDKGYLWIPEGALFRTMTSNTIYQHFQN